MKYTLNSNFDYNDGLSNLLIIQTKFGSEFTVNGNHFRIGVVKIKFSLDQVGYLGFNDLLISRCIIEGDNSNSTLIFNGCNFSSLSLDRLNNSGKFKLIDCKPIINENSEIIIRNSDLGKMALYNIDLSAFTWIGIHNSNISGMETSNVDWFFPSHLQFEPNNLKLLESEMEVYRQLRQICENNGNKIKALDFKAQELDRFENILKHSQSSFFSNDRLILLLSKTNDFGLNWKKPLCHIILITITIYPLVVISGSEELLCMPANSFEEVKKTLIIVWNKHSVLWQMFNPARLTFRMFPEVKELNGWTHFFDNIHRLILAFYIVQIVSAFRKYIK